MNSTLNEEVATLTELERKVLNHLQGGFPVCQHPFAVAAGQLNIDEKNLIEIVKSLDERHIITRFGPLFDIQKAGGNFCLCAIAAPVDSWQLTADQLNALPEVAHNYLRRNLDGSSKYNLWFVLATQSQQELNDVINRIAEITGFSVLVLPKEKEYFIGLHLEI